MIARIKKIERLDNTRDGDPVYQIETDKGVFKTEPGNQVGYVIDTSWTGRLVDLDVEDGLVIGVKDSSHAEEIQLLRATANRLTHAGSALAADLLELHDRTSISLDHWTSAKDFVRETYGWALAQDIDQDLTFDQIISKTQEIPRPNGV